MLMGTCWRIYLKNGLLNRWLHTLSKAARCSAIPTRSSSHSSASHRGSQQSPSTISTTLWARRSSPESTGINSRWQKTASRRAITSWKRASRSLLLPALDCSTTQTDLLPTGETASQLQSQYARACHHQPSSDCRP